jgi:hypothetical protein
VAIPPSFGVLAHGQGVGFLHPVKGVDIDPVVPGLHLLGIHFQEQSQVAGDHEALDVVGVGVFQAALYRIGGAAHFGLPGPVPAGQGPGMPEVVLLGQLRHGEAVELPHVLPPAQDLPSQSPPGWLSRRWGSGLLEVVPQAALDHKSGGEHLGVHSETQKAVVEEGLGPVSIASW